MVDKKNNKWAESLEKRRKMTFEVKSNIYQEIPPFPREITLDINNRCNHKCFFCANPKIEHYDILDTSIAFDLMKQGIENGCTDLALQATGEPFMDKRLPIFVSEGKKLGYEYIYINTNGALATPKRAQPVIDAGCHSIKFSINANNREDFKEVHGYDDFEKVIENLKWMFEYRNKNNIQMGIYVSSVKSSKYKEDYENIKKYIIPYCDNFDARDVSNQGGSMMELNDTEEIKKGNILGSLKKEEFTTRCVYPFNRMVIDPYGFVVACTADFHNKLSIGDVRKNTLKQIWESDSFKFLRNRHLNEDYTDLFCERCLNNTKCETKKLSEVFKN
jgi:radical SAM protein with 4Fe4S-binding SPASM domain